MTVSEFFAKLDIIMPEYNNLKTRDFLEDSLQLAIKDNNTALIITVLNELIGFLRDISEYNASYKYASSLLNLVRKVSLDSKSLVITLINVANAYRAYGALDESISLFDEANGVIASNKLDMPREQAALYNNMALAFQGKKEYERAIECLAVALTIVSSLDEIKKASTYTNMANCYLALNNLDLAHKALTEAKSVYDMHPHDFHASGYYGAFGKYYFMLGDYDNAIVYYEQALSHLLSTVGKNSYYNDTIKELFIAYKKKNINPHIMGLELAKEYYASVKEELFNKIPKELHSSLTIGLFGLGSECYKMDDIISEDHDFDPGFIILVNDDVTKEDFKQIASIYKGLNKYYKRYYVFNLDKKGVHYYSNYLKDYLGYSDKLSILSKSLITNGEIFYSGYLSSFNKIRADIIKETSKQFPLDLIKKTLEINQYIPYNLKRSLDRNDKETYNLLRGHLKDRLIEYYYIYHKKYMPHDKLMIKMIDKNSIIRKWLSDIDENRELDICEEISAKLLNNLLNFGFIKKIDTIYIEDYKNELIGFMRAYTEKTTIIDEIVDLEWNFFKALNNIGGKASCQNNKPFFILMRRAQAYAFNMEFLNSYLNDLRLARDNNYNLLEIKYAFMEETVDPVHFEGIKERLPLISEKHKALIEEIVKLQLAQKLDYDELYDSSAMRDNFTESDNIYNASYETYLRGELKSYSEKTAYLYATNLVEYEKNKLNIVKTIMNYTKILRSDETVGKE